MAKITVNKIPVTDGSFIHEITWTFDSGQTRAIKLMEEAGGCSYIRRGKTILQTRRLHRRYSH